MQKKYSLIISRDSGRDSFQNCFFKSIKPHAWVLQNSAKKSIILIYFFRIRLYHTTCSPISSPTHKSRGNSFWTLTVFIELFFEVAKLSDVGWSECYKWFCVNYLRGFTMVSYIGKLPSAKQRNFWIIARRAIYCH